MSVTPLFIKKELPYDGAAHQAKTTAPEGFQGLTEAVRAVHLIRKSTFSKNINNFQEMLHFNTFLKISLIT